MRLRPASWFLDEVSVSGDAVSGFTVSKTVAVLLECKKKFYGYLHVRLQICVCIVYLCDQSYLNKTLIFGAMAKQLITARAQLKSL